MLLVYQENRANVGVTFRDLSYEGLKISSIVKYGLDVLVALEIEIYLAYMNQRFVSSFDQHSTIGTIEADVFKELVCTYVRSIRKYTHSCRLPHLNPLFLS